MIQSLSEYNPAKILEECTHIEIELKSGARKPLTQNELAGKTGELEYSAGFQYICNDCKTSYPVNTERSIAGIALIPDARTGKALCNGHGIDLCPWCRPDSAPWKNGKGV